MNYLDETKSVIGIINFHHDIGYKCTFGPDNVSYGSAWERKYYNHVVLIRRFQSAIEIFNATIPMDSEEFGTETVLRPTKASFTQVNWKKIQLFPFWKQLDGGV